MQNFRIHRTLGGDGFWKSEPPQDMGVDTLRPSLKAATLSAVIRSLAEAAVENPGGVSYSFSAPALREIELHLSRIAAALQRCLLTGTPVSDQLRNVEAALATLQKSLKR